MTIEKYKEKKLKIEDKEIAYAAKIKKHKEKNSISLNKIKEEQKKKLEAKLLKYNEQLANNKT